MLDLELIGFSSRQDGAFLRALAFSLRKAGDKGRHVLKRFVAGRIESRPLVQIYHVSLLVMRPVTRIACG